MSNLFENAENFTANLIWDTIKVVNMSGMFLIAGRLKDRWFLIIQAT
jgi:hypothetical protein